MLSVASDGLWRCSEVAAVEVEDFIRQLGGHGLLRIRRSKSDQEGRGAFVRLRESTMTRVERWLRVSGIRKGRLFVLHQTNLNLAVKRRIEQVLGSSEGYSSHSLRIGAAQSLNRRGASLPHLMMLGRWRSACVAASYVAGDEVDDLMSRFMGVG